MKPCRRYKKRVALLAASALSNRESVEVERHLAQCDGCQEYRAAVAGICEVYRREVQGMAPIEPGPGFYLRIIRRVRGDQDEQVCVSVPHHPWRIRFAWFAAALAIVGGLLFVPSGHRDVQLPNPGPNPPAQIDVERRVGDSRYRFYRVALSRSFEEFDFLLARENPMPTRLGEPRYQLRSAWRNLDL